MVLIKQRVYSVFYITLQKSEGHRLPDSSALFNVGCGIALK